MRRLAAATAALATLPLAACGDGGDAPARAVTVERASGIRIVAREYSFDPARVTVEGDGPLRVTLANDGTLAHNLRLRRGGREVGGTPTFGGGESRSSSVELSEGSYSMVCTVGSHEELGMRGTLVVR